MNESLFILLRNSNTSSSPAAAADNTPYLILHQIPSCVKTTLINEFSYQIIISLRFFSFSLNEFDLNIQVSDCVATNLPQKTGVEGRGLITICVWHPAVWWAGRDLLSPGGRSKLTLISSQSDRREL